MARTAAEQQEGVEDHDGYDAALAARPSASDADSEGLEAREAPKRSGRVPAALVPRLLPVHLEGKMTEDADGVRRTRRRLNAAGEVVF